eukprot:TRINITY_DN11246_c0_g1_i1.p2 TRINITY_DN11246_c0_g1~~TRINITY_DN11246_c0_g1_i1.p2  ORF type:complete len:108 (+),score=4.22 TRINITY_DN11246_c0_g1_i1:529-852(+)
MMRLCVIVQFRQAALVGHISIGLAGTAQDVQLQVPTGKYCGPIVDLAARAPVVVEGSGSVSGGDLLNCGSWLSFGGVSYQDALGSFLVHQTAPVSYTHLTLPTKRIV